MGKAKDLATGEDRFANVAGDTFTGTVIHNGNVGIGTSPSVPLQVAKAGGANWMAASDYVDVTFVGGSNSQYYNGQTELTFQGYLLG